MLDAIFIWLRSEWRSATSMSTLKLVQMHAPTWTVPTPSWAWFNKTGKWNQTKPKTIDFFNVFFIRNLSYPIECSCYPSLTSYSDSNSVLNCSAQCIFNRSRSCGGTEAYMVVPIISTDPRKSNSYLIQASINN